MDREHKPKRMKYLVLVILLGALIFVPVWYYRDMMVNNQIDNPVTVENTVVTPTETTVPNTDLSERDIINISDRVSELIGLPAGQEPLVATITNSQDLATQQEFYRGAQNGDVLLIYPDTQTAAIYRAENDFLVNVGPLLVGE